MVFVFLAMGGLFLTSCNEKDDVAPIITLNGADTIFHVLNVAYKDPGVDAIDDTDGDVSGNVFIDNQVDIDRVGEYTVTYRVVDEAGNEATPVTRIVYVVNEAISYYGDYVVEDHQVYPEVLDCAYPSYIWIDSTVNMRLVFLDFACSSKRTVFADVLDTVIILPFQVIQDSIVGMTLQGAGLINDSTVSIDYTRTEAGSTSYWNVTFTRLQQ